ncbi:hypothetical protein V8C42DRAFT_22295 [Trichoderma barbatum]
MPGCVLAPSSALAHKNRKIWTFVECCMPVLRAACLYWQQLDDAHEAPFSEQQPLCIQCFSLAQRIFKIQPQGTSSRALFRPFPSLTEPCLSASCRLDSYGREIWRLRQEGLFRDGSTERDCLDQGSRQCKSLLCVLVCLWNTVLTLSCAAVQEPMLGSEAKSGCSVLITNMKRLQPTLKMSISEVELSCLPRTWHQVHY